MNQSSDGASPVGNISRVGHAKKWFSAGGEDGVDDIIKFGWGVVIKDVIYSDILWGK